MIKVNDFEELIDIKNNIGLMKPNTFFEYNNNFYIVSDFQYKYLSNCNSCCLEKDCDVFAIYDRNKRECPFEKYCHATRLNEIELMILIGDDNEY